jgi:hypothetical protein
MTAPASPTTSNLETVIASRDRFADRIKRRLGKPVLTLIDARDGIRDCFVSTYLGGVAAGVQGLQLNPSAEQLEAIAEQIFRRRLGAHGISWDAPTADSLERVKLEADRELHFDQLPAELHAVHDQVCSLLLAKVSGALPHRGDVSVVTREARQQDEVEQSMRRTIAAFLSQFRDVTERGETAEQLLARLGTLSRLIETLQAVSKS